MDNPLVSVLTPSFNQGRWLRDNLDSVTAQTYRPIEHIVMDGGSSDSTAEVLANAADHVRWWMEPDRGQSHALNKAFAASSGDIIGWLNSDDAYFSPRAVEEAVDLFQREPEVGVVYGHAVLVNASNSVLQVLRVPRRNAHQVRIHNFVIQPAAFIRRRALGQTIVDERFEHSMDRELWLRLASSNVSFARLPELVAIDRHQPGRKVYTRQDLAAADLRNLIEKYGVQTGPFLDRRAQLNRIRGRIAGVTLFPQLKECSFRIEKPSYAKLLLQQLFTPRSRMAMG